MTKDWRKPIHPGEHLTDELEEIGISGLELARLIGLPHNRIYQILRGERSITASTALRLGKFFNVDPAFWLNLQRKYDLEVAREKESGDLKNIKPFKRIKAKPTADSELSTSCPAK